MSFENVRDRLALGPSVGLLVERGDLDVADVAAFGVIAHRPNANESRALVMETSIGLSASLRMIFNRVLLSGSTLHLVDGLVECETLDLLVVDRWVDHVARHDAGLGRRSCHRSAPRPMTKPSSIVTSMPSPTELAVGGLLHIAPALLVSCNAIMRIERGDHAVDGTLDEL